MSIMEVLVAVLVGGSILFVWGLLAWFALPLHIPFLRRFRGEAEDSLRELLRQGETAGLYMVPGSPHPRTRDRQKQRAIDDIHRQRVRRGPVAVMALKPHGADFGITQFVRGFLLQLTASGFATALILVGSADTYGQRLSLVLLAGLIAWIVTHASYCNWMHFPLGYTLSQLVDLAVGWTLLGLWLAWITG